MHARCLVHRMQAKGRRKQITCMARACHPAAEFRPACRRTGARSRRRLRPPAPGATDVTAAAPTHALALHGLRRAIMHAPPRVERLFDREGVPQIHLPSGHPCLARTLPTDHHGVRTRVCEPGTSVSGDWIVAACANGVCRGTGLRLTGRSAAWPDAARHRPRNRSFRRGLPRTLNRAAKPPARSPCQPCRSISGAKSRPAPTAHHSVARPPITAGKGRLRAKHGDRRGLPGQTPRVSFRRCGRIQRGLDPAIAAHRMMPHAGVQPFRCAARGGRNGDRGGAEASKPLAARRPAIAARESQAAGSPAANRPRERDHPLDVLRQAEQRRFAEPLPD
jgi:hypothetical protein